MKKIRWYDKENYLHHYPLSWGYWGATEDMWLGGNWARGRALQKNIWKKDPGHNFCSILSGAIGFLNGGDNIPQEISIQLWRINPCCPGTKEPLEMPAKKKYREYYSASRAIPCLKCLTKENLS